MFQRTAEERNRIPLTRPSPARRSPEYPCPGQEFPRSRTGRRSRAPRGAERPLRPAPRPRREPLTLPGKGSAAAAVPRGGDGHSRKAQGTRRPRRPGGARRILGDRVKGHAGDAVRPAGVSGKDRSPGEGRAPGRVPPPGGHRQPRCPPGPAALTGSHETEVAAEEHQDRADHRRDAGHGGGDCGPAGRRPWHRPGSLHRGTERGRAPAAARGGGTAARPGPPPSGTAAAPTPRRLRRRLSAVPRSGRHRPQPP